MVDIDRERLRALAEDATPGPWRNEGDGIGVELSEAPWHRVVVGIEETGTTYAPWRELRLNPADAEYIAAANPAVVLELLDVLREAEASKNGAYNERDRCVALIARMANALGYRAGLGEHPREDVSWDHDWRTIVFVDLPAGQASWHIHDSERPLFVALDAYSGQWDGHSTEEKYRRVDLTPLINERADKEREIAQEWQRRALAAEGALRAQCKLLDDEDERSVLESLLDECERIARAALAEIAPR